MASPLCIHLGVTPWNSRRTATEGSMRRPMPAVPLPCFALLPACLWLASGCGNNTNPLTFTPTPTPPTQSTNAPSCSSCTPFVSLSQWSAGLKPGASMTFSASTSWVSDPSVIWTVKEGPAGGAITDTGVYSAPSTEGVYHVTATSKANSALSQTAIIAVTAAEFTVTGAMSVERWEPTASLLSSGQVFIAGGGDDDYNIADQAELYDPATGTFHLAGKVSREGHSATLLANGDVLLAGGFPLDNTADLLKAGSGAIQPTGNLAISREGHSATLLQDGRVLLAGGVDFRVQKATQTAEIYDPTLGKFTPAGDMTTPRGNNSAALLPNGKVLIVGGAAGAELYDPTTNSFLPAPTVSANRCSASATTLANGRVLIAGGTDCSNTILDTAEIYDPTTGQSTTTGKLVAAQAYATATLLPNGHVLLVGGSVPNLSQFFDPATDSFTFGPHLINPATGPVTLLSDGSVFVNDSKYAEIYHR